MKGLHLIAEDLGQEGWLAGHAPLPVWACDWVLFARWLQAWAPA